MASFEISAHNPDDRVLKKAVATLADGGVVICPTDTFYAFVCTLSNRSGIEEVCRLVGKKPEKANLSIICSDLKHISDYTQQFSKSIYKMLNRNLPGPFTFILKANSKVPRLFLNNRKTLGIRVPDHKVPRLLVELCSEPLVAASVHHPDNPSEMLTDPYEIETFYGGRVGMLLDAGEGGHTGSAIIDCSGEEPILVREGPVEIL